MCHTTDSSMQCVVTIMIIMESESAYAARMARRKASLPPPAPAAVSSTLATSTNESSHPALDHDLFAFTDADPHILQLLRDGPMRITSVINVVCRLLPSRNKRQRLAIKKQTLLRIPALIRGGQLRRVRRVLVGLNLPHLEREREASNRVIGG